MTTIAIIGAGTMGSHLALELASHGYAVILKDIGQVELETSARRMRTDFKSFGMMKGSWRQLTIEALLEKIIFTTSYDRFGEAQLVIENIPEDWEQKRKVYVELRECCDPATIYSVNTSCISITKIAALLPDPSRVIGMHFMNPVPLKELVEMIKGFHTSEETIGVAKDFLRSIGKLPVLVNDSTGFVANRLSHLLMNEAVFLVQEGVAQPGDIDLIFKKGYGHAMGPLETADLIGLDTVLNSLRILYDSYQDTKFRCCPLLEKMVSAGLLGRKTGKGFYQY